MRDSIHHILMSGSKRCHLFVHSKRNSKSRLFFALLWSWAVARLQYVTLLNAVMYYIAEHLFCVYRVSPKYLHFVSCLISMYIILRCCQMLYNSCGNQSTQRKCHTAVTSLIMIQYAIHRVFWKYLYLIWNKKYIRCQDILKWTI